MRFVAGMMALVMALAVPVESFAGKKYEKIGDCWATVDPSPYSNWLNQDPDDQFQELLVGLGTTNSPDIDLGKVRKSGRMELGIDLPKGRTLILAYTIMARAGRAVLNKITLVKKNGQTERISDDPVDEKLRPRRIQFKGDKKLERQINEAAFPAVIPESMLSRVFGGDLAGEQVWLNYSKPEDLRAIGPEGTGVLRPMVTGTLRYLKSYVTKRLTNKVLGWGFTLVLFGTVGVLLSAHIKIPHSSLIGNIFNVSKQEKSEPVTEKDVKPVLAAVKNNSQIVPVERDWLLSLLESNKPIPSSDASQLNLLNVDLVDGADKNIFWLRDRVSGAIFVGKTTYKHRKDKTGRLDIDGIIQIPRYEMKDTFAAITKLFPPSQVQAAH